MALIIHNGNEYPVKTVRSGESKTKGKWLLCVINEAGKGKQEAALFVDNLDSGLVANVDDGCTVRVDSFGVELEDCEGGKLYAQEFPANSGRWATKLSFGGCIVHKIGEAADSFEGGDFAQGTFEDLGSGGELPF